MATTNDIVVTRIVTMSLSPPPTIQGLVDGLNALIAKPAIGTDSVVQRINGGNDRFELVLTKPDT